MVPSVESGSKFNYKNALLGAVISGLVLVSIERGHEVIIHPEHIRKPVIFTNREGAYHTEVHLFAESEKTASTVTFGKSSYILNWITRKGFTGTGSLICYSLGSEGAVAKGKFQIQDDFVKNELVFEVELNGGQKVKKSLAENE